MLKGIWTFIGIVILAIILALVVWSYANAYDQKKPDVDPVISNEACFTYVRVKVIGTAEGMYYSVCQGGWNTKETLFEQIGSGFVVKEGFVITVAHVIVPDNVSTIIDRYGVHNTEPLRVLNTLILIYHFSDNPIIAKLHYINRELDIAILKYEPSGILEPTPYGMEYCGYELKANDVVFSFLHKRDENDEILEDVELVYGKVLSPRPTTSTMGSELAWFNLYDMTLDMKVRGGDSGSPLFAFRDGVPVFIGIIRAMRHDEIIDLTYAVSLPKIRRYLLIGGK